MGQYIPVFLKTQEAIDKQRARKRCNTRTYREAHPEYLEREAIRLDKRHHTLEKWKLNPENTVAVMWDGEATDGIHYNILQAHAEGKQWKLEVDQSESIGLRAALHWFKKIKRELVRTTQKKVVFVGFGTRYDWEMMLLAEPTLSIQDKIDIARQSGRNYKAVRLEHEQLEQFYPQLGAAIYLGRKVQRVQFPFNKKGKLLYEKLEFQDIHTFFARSFIRALDMFKFRWNDASTDLAPLFDLIVRGKEARGDFAGHGFTPEMVEQYNSAELVMCEWLWKTVLALCTEIGIFPKSLAGPAPMARAALERYGLRSHIKPAEYDTIAYQEGEWMRVCREAYKGGRIELMVQGIVQQWFEADLTSAYPSTFQKLPCLAHGTARQASQDEIDAANQGNVPDTAICELYWKMPESMHFGVFPCRDHTGGIHYPLEGAGWHHADLVQVYQKWNGGDWDISNMWIWEPDCELVHPFEELIHDLFTQRQRLLAEGNAAEYLLKLTMNSMYGILAQMAGFARIINEDGETIAYKSPRYTNLYGAGKITAATQAALMRVALPQHEQVIAFATDAVYTTEPLAIAESEMTDDTHKELGKWVVVKGAEPRYFIAPGVSIGPSGKSKTRGFGAMPSYTSLTAAYLANDPVYEYKEQRFQNILKSKRHDKYGNLELSPDVGTFVIEERTLTLDAYGLTSKRDTLRGIQNWGTCRYIPPYAVQQGHNQPYMRVADSGKQYVDEDMRRPDDYEA